MSQVQAQTQETKREYRRSPQVVLRLSRDERKTLFAFAKAHVRKARIAVKEALKEAQSLAKKEAAEKEPLTNSTGNKRRRSNRQSSKTTTTTTTTIRRSRRNINNSTGTTTGSSQVIKLGLFEQL